MESEEVRRSIKKMRFNNEVSCFEFEFDEVVHTNEAILVPVRVTSKSYFGLAFIDTNDSSLYVLEQRVQTQVERGGLRKDFHPLPEQLNRIGYVDQLHQTTLFQKVT